MIALALGTKLAYLHILPFSSRLKGVYSTDNHDCAILYNIPAQVLSCVSQLLLCDPTPQVQRAALLVFSLLLKGLSHKTISVLGDSLHDIYHLLKHVEEEEREREGRADKDSRPSSTWRVRSCHERLDLPPANSQQEYHYIAFLSYDVITIYDS